MNISGVVVRAHPKHLATVQSQLGAMPGVEVHAATDDGRMVVTVEDDAANMVATINAFHDIKGVVSASLIYHHFDEFQFELEA